MLPGAALRVLLVIINKDHLTFLWPYFLMICLSAASGCWIYKKSDNKGDTVTS